MKKAKFPLLLLTTVSLTLLPACRSSTDAKVNAAVQDTAMSSSSDAGLNTLTDADAGAVAHTINDGEIQMAQVALINARSQQVREYAQMMINDHTNGNSMLEQHGYRAAVNPVTQVLNADVNKQLTMLRGMSGEQFDRHYIASQIDMHTTALNTMRTTLMPSAKDDDLRNTLGTMRDTVQMHLDHARRIQGVIGGRP
jgi:putative membrane protein